MTERIGRAGSRRSDGYLPIEDYAAIGDGRTLVLVGIDGSIDWMCLPELDGPSVFGALLDPENGGEFKLAPTDPHSTERRYLERTNVLETTFRTEHGTAKVIDAVTIDKSQAAPWRELARQIEVVSGEMTLAWRVRPRFEYGQRTPAITRDRQATIIRDGGLQLALRVWPKEEPTISDGIVSGTLTMHEGQRALLAMVASDGPPLRIPERAGVERRLEDTVDVWRSWTIRHTYEGPWTAAVERSLLAIRLLADGRTGAIAAAGTTSLPEAIGGERNYDYRYGWVRDLCFTLDALLAVGMEELTQSSVTWLLDATASTHPRIDPVYKLGGHVLRTQQELALPGYRRTGPVLLGNNAGSQLQLGGFGDFVETMASYVEDGHVLSPETGERLADIVDLLANIWRNEDSGLWELPDEAHYGTSKLGCWVAFERLLDLVDDGHVPARHVARWKRERDQTRRFIEEHLYSEDRNCYLLKAGSDELDCGMLLAARRHFDREGDRLAGTVKAVSAELRAEQALFYRYSGMQEQENAFLACSFWMVEALALSGRVDEAAEMMDAAVGLSNDVGLYSEEMEPGSHAMRGNFPQALTHLAVISAASIIASVD